MMNIKHENTTHELRDTFGITEIVSSDMVTSTNYYTYSWSTPGLVVSGPMSNDDVGLPTNYYVKLTEVVMI